MEKCMSCGKLALLPSTIGNIVLCRNCASIIDVVSWENRDFSSMEELLSRKNEVMEKASVGNLSQPVIEKISHYFDEYIDAGFITTIDGKAGQILKVFANHCIVITKNENKKEDLKASFYQFDDGNYDDDDEVFTYEEKRNLANSLLSGRLVQTGIGAAVSATLKRQEKEKNAERRCTERRINLDRLITIGERRVNLSGLSSIEVFSKKDVTNGYLKFVKNGAKQTTLYNCDYFFFNNSIPFKSKKIKQEVENIKNFLTERLAKIKQESLASETQAKERQRAPQTNTVDIFEEIRKYKQLLDENIITEEEFNLKKKQLLKL